MSTPWQPSAYVGPQGLHFGPSSMYVGGRPDCPLPPGDPPPGPRVQTALQFIAHCNSQMVVIASRPAVGGDCPVEIVSIELHPVQEAVFRLACQVVGQYFSGPASPAETAEVAHAGQRDCQDAHGL